MLTNVLQWGGIVIAATSIIIAIYKTIKEGKKDKLIKLAKVVQKIPSFIIEAEQVLGSGTGPAKHNYVLNKIHIECLQFGIKYDEVALSQEIENVLATPQKKEELTWQKEAQQMQG